MQGIDCNRSGTGEAVQESAFDQPDLMRRSVLNVQRIIGILLVAVIPRHFMHLLVQRAAEGDIQFLKAAAHCKKR